MCVFQKILQSFQTQCSTYNCPNCPVMCPVKSALYYINKKQYKIIVRYSLAKALYISDRDII